MEHGTGCLICGAPLVYGQRSAAVRCFYCGAASESNAACANGHFVCDACHSGSANDLIQRFAAASLSTAPLADAVALMRNPKIKMHGPEHHFLVPAVLLSAYYNRTGDPEGRKAEAIATARKRSDDIKGGFCGFCGNCGAGVGTGIYMSLVTGSTPVSGAGWRLSNLMTSESLRAIAERGGPRCCKRDTFTAIQTAVEFTRRELGVSLDAEGPVVCGFSALNKECRKMECPFFPRA